ncbi:hypothetical protein MP228_012217 [Amoeboaphelidium protococcarum]|nr:hypothetical protein MP228_012217 [Amoeboaphelidium protococcarum]
MLVLAVFCYINSESYSLVLCPLLDSMVLYQLDIPSMKALVYCLASSGLILTRLPSGCKYGLLLDDVPLLMFSCRRDWAGVSQQGSPVGRMSIILWNGERKVAGKIGEVGWFLVPERFDPFHRGSSGQWWQRQLVDGCLPVCGEALRRRVRVVEPLCLSWSKFNSSNTWHQGERLLYTRLGGGKPGGQSGGLKQMPPQQHVASSWVLTAYHQG